MDLVTIERNVPAERSETQPGKCTFHVSAYIYVPITFELSVEASDIHDACRQMADHVAKNRLDGVRRWDWRTPAYISGVRDELGEEMIVPKRYTGRNDET